jgi:membrane protein
MLSLLPAAAQKWIEDEAPTLGAAIAFYTVFSLSPVLLTVIAVAGLVFGDEAVRGSLYGELAGLVGVSGADAIQKLVESASRRSEGLLAALTAPVLFVLGATAVFTQLQTALNAVWRTKGPTADQAMATTGMKSPQEAGTMAKAIRAGLALLRIRLLSFGLIIGGGFLLTVSLAVNALLVGLGKSFDSELRLIGGVLWAVQLLVSTAVLTGLFAAIYKLLPDTRVDWVDVWTGGLITAVLFNLGKFAIGAYLASTDVASSYGAAGTMILMLLWVYYSAQVFLYGAEVTWLRRQRRLGKTREA